MQSNDQLTGSSPDLRLQSMYCDHCSPIENISTESFHAERTSISYNFSHELNFFPLCLIISRIQQAFFSLIPESELQLVHLKLCRVLNQLSRQDEKHIRMELEQDERNVYVKSFPGFIANDKSICNHANHCLDLIVDQAERLQFASLNNICAERALESASFERALDFVKSARRLIHPDIENLPDHLELVRSIYLNLVIALYR